MCPHCGREAPIVYRGPVATCTACNGVRLPMSGPSINLAGKASQVGGAAAKAVGWLVLAFGTAVALGLGLLVGGLTSATIALFVAAPVALFVLVASVVLLGGGRVLSRRGAYAARSTRDAALLELAAHRGRITASDAARALSLPVADADSLLTSLAKRSPEQLALEVDEQGVVWYRTARLEGADGAGEARARVSATDEDAERAAFDEALAREQEAARARARR